MAKRVTDAQRRGIATDLRAGQLTQSAIAEKAGVGLRTVQKVSAGLKDEPTANPLMERLNNLLASAEEALELARASKDSRELAAAVRAFRSTLEVVEKLTSDIERQDEGGTRRLVEAVKAILVEELKPYPKTRARVAERLFALGGAKP